MPATEAYYRGGEQMFDAFIILGMASLLLSSIFFILSKIESDKQGKQDLPVRYWMGTVVIFPTALFAVGTQILSLVVEGETFKVSPLAIMFLGWSIFTGMCFFIIEIRSKSFKNKVKYERKPLKHRKD